MPELLVHILVFDDGARDQLREHGDIGAEGDDVLLHVRVSPVDVDKVTHRLEGVERYADGQGQIWLADGRAEDGVYIGDDKI